MSKVRLVNIRGVKKPIQTIIITRGELTSIVKEAFARNRRGNLDLISWISSQFDKIYKSSK